MLCSVFECLTLVLLRCEWFAAAEAAALEVENSVKDAW